MSNTSGALAADREFFKALADGNGEALNRLLADVFSPYIKAFNSIPRVVLGAIFTIAFGGSNPGDFSQSNNCPVSPATLAAGGSCTISVTFTLRNVPLMAMLISAV